MMNVILNEKDYAIDAIRYHKLGDNPDNTLKYVSGYYYSEGLKKNAIKEKLKEFLLRCDSNVDLYLWEDEIEFYSKTAKNRRLVELDYIPITKKEIELCLSQSRKHAQRLLFVLICLAKFNYYAYGKEEGWVNTKHSEIFKMANIITSTEDQHRLFRALRDSGVIRFSKKVTSLSIAVQCMDLDGDVEIEIMDFRNLGNQLRKYQGENFIECEGCGLIVAKKTNNQKYCRSCSVEINRANSSRQYLN